MDLDFNAEENAFRDEVRAFLKAHLPSEISTRIGRGDDSQIAQDIPRWQSILHKHGWGAPAWPKAFGGTGWTTTQQYIFETECALADAPIQLPFGLKMVAPVMMRYGNAEQHARFLPRILSGEDWWCQGYSEPGSGSDLASLKTRAVRDGDDYIVDGQKVWNTLGQFADWIFCLVRTDSSAKSQQGISFLLIDMKSPGIKVQPTRLLDGTHEVNEIWFDNVRVPVANRIGEENDGWTYAKFLLGHERTNIAGIGIAKRELARLKRIATQELKQGRPLIEDPLFAAQIAQVEIDLWALEITNLRVLSAERRSPAAGPEASILKIKGTEIQQSISELMMRAVGPYALPFRREAMEAGWQFDPEREPPGPRYAATLAGSYFNQRKLSIFGGTNEIQKNIISKMIVGL